MKDRGQYGAQEKLRVVQRRIGQNILLHDQRPGRIGLIVRCARQRCGGRLDRAGYRRRGAVAWGEILSIVERDDLGASPGDKVALEMLRDVDRGDRVARADRVRGARHIAGTLRDADARRRSDRLDIDQRGRGAIRVHDGDFEIADDRIAEDRGQNREGDDRHAEREEQRHAVAPHPAQFACRDKKESRPRRRPHRCPPGHSA